MKRGRTRTGDDGAGERIVIDAPRFGVATLTIRGTAPYVQNRPGPTAVAAMRAKMVAGSTTKKGQKREPKDFRALYEETLYRGADGAWHGIPAIGLRKAMVSACRLVGFTMTIGKLAVFVDPDGFDASDGTPLVRITKGEPQYLESFVKNETGVPDIRPRPMWLPGWEARVRVRFDADQMTLGDVCNLLHRVGQQVGIGAGRADSPRSCGMGWGFFEVLEEVEAGRAVA